MCGGFKINVAVSLLALIFFEISPLSCAMSTGLSNRRERYVKHMCQLVIFVPNVPTPLDFINQVNGWQSVVANLVHKFRHVIKIRLKSTFCTNSTCTYLYWYVKADT